MNNDPWLEAPPAPKRRRRRWVARLILVATPLLALAAVWGYLLLSSERQQREALAEADRLDPGWRFEALEARRAVLPDERNSAVTVMAAKRLLPEGWPAWDYPKHGETEDEHMQRVALQDSFHDIAPPRRLNPEQLAALRAELARVAPALTRARALVDLSEGRYPITYSPDFIDTLLPHIQDARQIANLLAYDALQRAEAGDADGALGSCRAVLNTARSIGDEPFLIAQLVRIACRAVALAKAERVLAQGEPSEAALLALQQLLEREEGEPLLLIAARGERAGIDRLLERLQTGESRLSPRDLEGMTGPSGGPDLAEMLTPWGPSSIGVQRAAMLRYLTQMVEAVKLPPEQVRPRLKQLEATWPGQPHLVRLLAPAMSKVADADCRSRAELRCAIVALAAERYRRAQQRWPETLDALQQAGYLHDVPTDLFDGQPLRLRRRNDGVTVYSIGPDGKDDGGHIDRQRPNGPGTDLGFRLWGPERRRQPPGG